MGKKYRDQLKSHLYLEHGGSSYDAGQDIRNTHAWYHFMINKHVSDFSSNHNEALEFYREAIDNAREDNTVRFKNIFKSKEPQDRPTVEFNALEDIRVLPATPGLEDLINQFEDNEGRNDVIELDDANENAPNLEWHVNLGERPR